MAASNRPVVESVSLLNEALVSDFATLRMDDPDVYDGAPREYEEEKVGVAS